MKKILISIIISSISLSAMADGVFNMPIPQPDFISTDWDNDGLPNNIDDDDDNDGVDDNVDSTPFGQAGRSSVLSPVVNLFTSNKISYLPGEDITLSWSIDNVRSLNLYNDNLLKNHIADVTNQTSIIMSPVGDVTYYIDTETGVDKISVFEYKEDSKSCGTWSPLSSTVNSGTLFNQTRNCSITYLSNETNLITKEKIESQSIMGTLAQKECAGNKSHMWKAQQNRDGAEYSIEIYWGSTGLVYSDYDSSGIGYISVEKNGFRYTKEDFYNYFSEDWGRSNFYQVCREPI